MSHLYKLAVLLFCSLLSVNVLAQDATTEQTTSTTTVNPVTQQAQTSQKTTITRTNPVTGETTTTIITSAPAPQDTVAVPQGYVNCFNVTGGWYQGVWISEHRVCQYDATKTSNQGAAYIDGHWTCTVYTGENCTKWTWREGHWVSAFTVY